MLYLNYLNYLFLSIWVDKLKCTFHYCLFSHDVMAAIFVSQNNETLSFVPINLHRCWQREWKNSINKPHSRKTLLESSKILVMTVGLSVNECLHLKKPENKIDWFRSSGCGDFKGLTRFRQDLLKISSIIKKWLRLCVVVQICNNFFLGGGGGVDDKEF